MMARTKSPSRSLRRSFAVPVGALVEEPEKSDCVEQRRAQERRNNTLTPVFPHIPVWSKWGSVLAVCIANLLAIYQSPDPLSDPFVLLVPLSVSGDRACFFPWWCW